ncbi:MAG: nucleotidyl transferase AbiEii/AbiGii toxin family protein [Pseudonocardiaceae bacterium]
MARLAGDARHTRDIDLYRQDDDLPAAENSLRAAAATDVDDFFHFTLDPAQRITQDRTTLRVSVIAYLGLREFARFHVDLVTNVTMTAPPEEVTPLVPVSLESVVTTYSSLKAKKRKGPRSHCESRLRSS